MSLRAKLIEAGAEALDGMPAALLGAAAGVVLDAFLDCLAENLEEHYHRDELLEVVLADLRESDV